MNPSWHQQQHPFKFMLSDKTLFAIHLPMQVRQCDLDEIMASALSNAPAIESLPADSQGYLIRSLPIEQEQPVLHSTGDYLLYTPSQYQRYYIDLQSSFDTYQKKFSSKTRSTIKRKIKKYEKHCGGDLAWKCYKTPEEMDEFFRLAREVSAKTYQEKLLDEGLPKTREFFEQTLGAAGDDRIRGFILFHGERPVSYLFCPANQGILLYQYQGYGPEYKKLSVGSVLFWLALEAIFAERLFRLFDFTEGESEHKRVYATHGVHCGDVYYLTKSLRNRLLLSAHRGMNGFSEWSGEILDRYGLKSKIKRLIRFRL